MLIRIPEKRYSDLAALYGLDDGEWQQLCQAIVSVGPTTYVTPLLKEIETSLGGFKSDSQAVLRMLGVLASLRIQLKVDVDSFVNDLKEASADTGEETLDPEKKNWTLIESSLMQVLGDASPLMQSQKLAGLQWDKPNPFEEARVLTDLRPSFGHNPADGIQHFILGHTLRLNYFDSGDSIELFLSLDANDLRELRDQLDRAIQKEVELYKSLKGSGFSVYGVNENEE